MRDLVLELRRIADEIDRGASQAEANLELAVRVGVDAVPFADRTHVRSRLREAHVSAIAGARVDAQLVRSAADLVERLRAQHRVADP